MVNVYLVAAAALCSAGFFLAGYALGVYLTERST